MKRILSVTSFLFACALANAVHAEDASSVYLGVGAGTTDYSLACLNGPCESNKHRFSGKIYLGYALPGVDLQGARLTNAFEVMAYTAGANDGGYLKFGGGGDKVRFRGIGLVDALSYKVDAFTATGRLGISTTRTSLDYGAGGYQNADKTGLMVGAGLAYTLNKHWVLKADLDRVPVSDLAGKKSLKLLTVGAGYSF